MIATAQLVSLAINLSCVEVRTVRGTEALRRLYQDHADGFKPLGEDAHPRRAAETWGADLDGVKLERALVSGTKFEGVPFEASALIDHPAEVAAAIDHADEETLDD